METVIGVDGCHRFHTMNQVDSMKVAIRDTTVERDCQCIVTYAAETEGEAHHSVLTE